MSKLGNIGGVEREAGPETLAAFYKLDRRIDVLERTGAETVRNNTVIVIQPPTVASNFPYGRDLSYPMYVTPSAQLFPSGLNLLPGTGYKVTQCEIICDPEAPAATADTSFTIQNAASSPTSSGIVTVLSGQKRGENLSLAVSVSAAQRFYIKAPSNLNGVQNLYHIGLVLNQP